MHSARSRVDTGALGHMLAALGANGPALERARAAGGAGEVLAAAGAWREPLARPAAARAREVALATLSGKTAVEVAIVDREGGSLTRVGGWRQNGF